jgi:hypothetical protein
VVGGADVDDCVAALNEREPGDDEGVDDAADAEIDRETVARYRRVAEADVESIRASDRFRDEFEELLTDAELSARLARDAREDGLQEATEDIETDVSL